MNATRGIDIARLGNLDSGSLRTRLASLPLLLSESKVDLINVELSLMTGGSPGGFVRLGCRRWSAFLLMNQKMKLVTAKAGSSSLLLPNWNRDRLATRLLLDAWLLREA